MSFDQDYYQSDEHEFTAKVFCMSCHALIRDHRYEMQAIHNDRTRSIAVYTPWLHSNYRQVPLWAEISGTPALIHVPVCIDCEKFELTPEVADKIRVLLQKAETEQQRWHGYPPELQEAVRRRWEATRILRRPEGEELIQGYSRQKGA